MTKFPALLVLTLSLLFFAETAPAQVSAMGAWMFDTARQDIYIQSVQASQIDTTTMSEIAVQMGMAQIQNSVYEFGFDKKSGPYLEIYDKTSKHSAIHPLKVEVVDGMLVMQCLDNGDKLRMEPINNERMTLVVVGKNLYIPLRRL